MKKDKYYIDLPLENGQKLFVNKEDLKSIKHSLEKLTYDNKRTNSVEFTKSVLFPYEVKSNDQIEGYTESIDSVSDIINNPNMKVNRMKEEYQRVRNITTAYRQILNRKTINEESLKKLYDILSKDILEDEDMMDENSIYRLKDVFIFYSRYLNVDPDKGIKPENVYTYMDELMNYINHSKSDNQIDSFIVSQIIHYYFVYVHPYYDVNGRTSRTLSLWYLIKNEAYPFTIFNRAIPYTKQTYYKIIREVKKYNNMTYFLNYMLSNVKKEIAKDEAIANIINGTPLTPLEVQALHYMFTMKGMLTALDFTKYYNMYNKKRKPKEIYDLVIEPLIKKEIITVTGESKHMIKGTKIYNPKLEVNCDLDCQELKKLILK